ncbi:unannotated protein [freshwater metagenome]|uniref:Unannotated protein n=1 Tax=freshwater metagenome TaxID=449393 RepID=A0A6J7XUY7_9ZZZZ
MILLVAIAGLINFILSEILDASILMLTISILIAISLFQERKTERALGALQELTAPKATVRRDGVEIKISSEEVVPGDLLILSEGDRIPADSQLQLCTNFNVDESMLTGESVSVRKQSGDLIFCATLVTQGHGEALVISTGLNTEVGKIGAALASIQIERTHLQQEVDRIVRVVAIASTATALLVVVVYGFSRGDWLEGALAAIAASMALIPEEFPVVLTVFLAMGAWRMSQDQVIARRAPAIETLGSVTVLCVDKTGTLTLNQMNIAEINVGGELHVLSQTAPTANSQEIARYGRLASPIAPFDPMDKAFHAITNSEETMELIREYPLSDELMAMTHIWRSAHEESFIVAAKGAPEAIALLCQFTHDQHELMIRDVDDATNRGFRVLGVAKARIAGEKNLPAHPSEIAFEFLGLVHLRDPVRPGVQESVKECATAGVRTIMLTGDYPGTALSIAREIGLDYENGVITGNELDQLDDVGLAKKIKSVSIFARVVPIQKLRLIHALKLNGEIVGMTGDGVNDAPALRAADIGIAMGQRGTDVAREAAALIITDDDFSSIAHGIRQGRTIYANLQKAMSYVIAAHVPIFGMALFPIFFAGWPLVLLPAQIAFLELIIDPASSVVFESEAPDPKIMQSKPRNVNKKIINKRIVFTAILQGIAVFAHALCIYLWARHRGMSDDHVRTLSFATLMIGNVSLVLTNRSRHLSIFSTLFHRANKNVKWVLLGSTSLIVLLFNVSFMEKAFNVTSMSVPEWAVVIFAGISSIAWFEVYKFTERSVRDSYLATQPPSTGRIAPLT